MSGVASIGKKIWRDKMDILNMIRREEKYIKVLYTSIIEEIIAIGKKARQNDGVTIISDLTGYRGELTSLINDFNNQKVKSDITSVVGKIDSFIMEYKGLSGSTLLRDGQMRIAAIVRFIVDMLNATLLVDLKQTYANFRELEDAYGRAA